MTAQIANKTNILRYEVLGARRLSNLFWAMAISIGGVGFLLAGLSSYLHQNLLPVGNATDLIFIPQGIALSAYGVLGTLLAIYLWLTIVWNVGSGYNEFNKTKKKVHIYRQGYPGKNRQVAIDTRFKDVQAIRVDIREGFNPKRALYLRVKGRGDYPLTRVGQPMSLTDLENQAAEIARFLEVPMEGL